MKISRKLFATLFLISIAGMATAQDVIVKKDQSTVMSKVLEITSTEIKYKKWNNQDGPTYSINRSEVVSINYENGEVDRFSDNTNNHTNSNNTQPSYSQNNGYMDVVNGSLKINGHVLTETEVRNLVDPENYQLYLKAQKHGNTGFILSSISSGAFILGGIYELIDEINDNNHKHLNTIIASGIVCIVTFIPGIVLESSSISKLNQVAENYNKKQGYVSYLNISPTLMNCEIPQSQGTCGLGLTLNLNF